MAVSSRRLFSKGLANGRPRCKNEAKCIAIFSYVCKLYARSIICEMENPSKVDMWFGTLILVWNRRCLVMLGFEVIVTFESLFHERYIVYAEAQ